MSGFEEMEQKVVMRREDHGVVWLTLNRPAINNAIDPELIQQMRCALEHIRRDGGVRVVVLQGAGKNFCAGADLAWMREVSQMDLQAAVQDSRPLQALYEEMHAMPVPLVGFAHGRTMAGGLGLLAACDCVVADGNARFAVSEVKLGLIPALLAPFLIQKIGASMLCYLALSGREVGAAEMKSAGLVHVLGEGEGAARAELDELIASLLRTSPDAVRMCKEMLRGLHLMPLKEALPNALEWVATSRGSACAQEGIAAFLQKRPPLWQAS